METVTATKLTRYSPIAAAPAEPGARQRRLPPRRQSGGHRPRTVRQRGVVGPGAARLCGGAAQTGDLFQRREVSDVAFAPDFSEVGRFQYRLSHAATPMDGGLGLSESEMSELAFWMEAVARHACRRRGSPTHL
jgi:hypothetical protein